MEVLGFTKTGAIYKFTKIEMEIVLRIEFEADASRQIEIKNPSHVPNAGDTVYFIPEEFTNNIDEIESLRKQEVRGILKVSSKIINSVQDVTFIMLTLKEESDKENSRTLFSLPS